MLLQYADLTSRLEMLEKHLNDIAQCFQRANVATSRTSDIQRAILKEKETLQKEEGRRLLTRVNYSASLLEQLFPTTIALKKYPDEAEQSLIDNLHLIRAKVRSCV